MLPLTGLFVTVGLFIWSVYANKIKKHKSTQTPIVELADQTTQTWECESDTMSLDNAFEMDDLDMEFFACPTPAPPHLK